MKLFNHEIRNLSTDHNDFFLRSVWHVAIGFAILAVAVFGIWEMTEIISNLPKGH